jgi:hypothetical protein
VLNILKEEYWTNILILPMQCGAVVIAFASLVEDQGSNPVNVFGVSVLLWKLTKNSMFVSLATEKTHWSKISDWFSYDILLICMYMILYIFYICNSYFKARSLKSFTQILKDTILVLVRYLIRTGLLGLIGLVNWLALWNCVFM